MVDIPFDATAGIAPAEVGEVELYHPKSWWTQYVFSQDARLHHHPVLDHGDVHRNGRAGAVMADAAATRIPRLPCRR